MRTIRENVFETNSSSTHSITINTEKEFKDLKNDKLYVCDTEIWTLADARNWIAENRSEVIHELDEYIRLEAYDSIAELLSNYHIETYSIWEDRMEDQGLDVYEKHFTSPSGDKLVAWGHYGYSG